MKPAKLAAVVLGIFIICHLIGIYRAYHQQQTIDQGQQIMVDVLTTTRDSLTKYDTLRSRTYEKAMYHDSLYQLYATRYDSVSVLLLDHRGERLRDSLRTRILTRIQRQVPDSLRR
jgi:hypothetical protein